MKWWNGELVQHLLGEGEQVCGGRLEGVQGAGGQVLGEGHPDPGGHMNR